MPYADPEERKAALRRWYRAKYADPKFAQAEAERKAAWLQTPEGQASNARATARYHRERKKRERKKKAR